MVSPFVSLPTATTLPYTYKTVPSTLPPSSTEGSPGFFSDETGKAQFIVSSSGRAAHPDDIVASCHALQAHLDRMEENARKALSEWEVFISERDLAEKRRVAPGWLDRKEKILEPSRASVVGSSSANANGIPHPTKVQPDSSSISADLTSNGSSEGEQLDRVFGAMRVK